MRRLLREIQARFKLQTAGGRFWPTVLMYHSVGLNRAHFTVRPEVFRKQMEFLKERGFEVVDLDTCLRRALAGETGKIVALTFDDGYSDFFEEAWPVLASFGFPATVFLITGSMGGMYTTSTGDEIPLMTWDTASHLKAEGVDFGSHTVTHAKLDALPPDDMKKQFADSGKALRERLGLEKSYVCYPYGRNSPSVRAAAKDAGYLGAVTIDAGHPGPTTDPFGIPRAYVHSEMGMIEFESCFL